MTVVTRIQNEQAFVALQYFYNTVSLAAYKLKFKKITVHLPQDNAVSSIVHLVVYVDSYGNVNIAKQFIWNNKTSHELLSDLRKLYSEEEVIEECCTFNTVKHLIAHGYSDEDMANPIPGNFIQIMEEPVYFDNTPIYVVPSDLFGEGLNWLCCYIKTRHIHIGYAENKDVNLGFSEVKNRFEYWLRLRQIE